MIRGLAATAAAAAVVGAVLMRSWDRAAGRRVAEVASESARRELTYEDRIAELEADAEKNAELQNALNSKLRAKRAELARLRNEHAALLRRYATAETERARALEVRRRLEREGIAPARELEAVAPARELESMPPVPEAPVAGAPVPDAPTAEAYARADEAMRHLMRDERGQREEREDREEREKPGRVPRQPLAEERAEGDRAADERAAQERFAEEHAAQGGPAQDRPAQDRPAQDRPAGEHPAGEPRPHTHTAASPVVPYAAARRAASRAEGGFDYFGTQKKQPKKRQPEPVEPAAAELPAPAEPVPAKAAEPAEPVERPEAAPDEDLADVIGAETLAEAGKGTVGEVIDLTAHDEDEHIDIPELRSAIS